MRINAGDYIIGQIISQIDISSNAYDFANRLTKTRRDHTATPPSGTLQTRTIREEYTYDHASRILFVRHKIDANPWVVTSSPKYDELGRVVDKRLHASNYDGVSAITAASTFSFLQSVDYSYNIRGWLTGINNPASCAIQSGDQLADLFSMSLLYDAPTSGLAADKQYNGNISEMQWRTFNATGSVCGQLNAYRLNYDKGNRLLNANHWTQTGAVWANTDNYSENNISYDLNGNIKTLNRRGATTNTSTFGQIDLLSYTYDAANPDKLLQIADGSGQTKGFKKTNASANYGYDANGNMTQDNNKVLGITYNHLNLPTTFTVNGSLITMTYTADGEKLTKVAGTNTKNYVSGIEYKGAALEAIYTSEGRCVPTTTNGSAFYYEYTIKDHLGNARVSFRANGAAVSVIQENHYYAFGMEMEGAWAAQAGVKNNYEYNGKELNEDFGLNLSDYGARWYDAAIGRWWSVDPLAEKFASKTSYNYGLNNPIRMIDPNGMESEAMQGGLSGLQAEMRDLSRKQMEETRILRSKTTVDGKAYNKSSNVEKTSVSLDVTDETVGTAKIYASGIDDNSNEKQYFEVSIYKMTAIYTDADGQEYTQNFEVLKYGVKEVNGGFEYRSFGGTISPTEDQSYEISSVDNHYKYGGFNIVGKYDLHPQHTDIRSLPTTPGGRVNFGCIGVCGKGEAGWKGLNNFLFRAAGLDIYVNQSLDNQKKAYSEILNNTSISITIRAFTLPSTIPTPIKKD
jgi:RHS repeat-associated protein